MNRIIKKFIFESPSFLFFALVSIVCIGLTIWSQCKIVKVTNVYEEQLVKLYNIAKKDSIQSPIIDMEKVSAILSSKGTTKSKNDETLKFCIAELSNYVKQEAARNNDTYNTYVTDIKHLLDNQYMRIRQEYEALQTWCAILTIVFLVFSFYSLYKADDMVKQGQKALTEIERIRRDGKTSIDSIQREAKDAVAEMKQKLSEEISKINTKLGEVDLQMSGTSTSINNELERMSKEVDAKVASAEKDYVERVEHKTTEIQQQLASVVSSVEAAMETMKNIQASIELHNVTKPE